MTTVVIYIDEAGSPERHHDPIVTGETPLFCLVGLALPLADWRLRDRGYFRLKRQFFPDMMGKPGKRDEEVEIKGRDLTKSSASPMSAHSMYCRALQILVERVSVYVAESALHDHAILICDSRMKGISGQDIEVARSHMSYIFGNETGRTFTNIVEAPLFADSRLTVGLQLADVVAANLYANHYAYYLGAAPGGPDYRHAERYWPALDRLQFKSKNVVDGFHVFGYRTIELRR